MSEDAPEQGEYGILDRVMSRGGNVDWTGFASGGTFILALIAGAAFIRSTAGSDVPNILNGYSALFVSFFIGSSAGHYYGMAIKNDGSSVHSAYLGAFTFLFIYWLYNVRVSALSAAMIFMASSLILAHSTDIIQNSRPIKRAVDYFAKGISPIGILLFGVFSYLPPGTIDSRQIIATIHDSLTQEVSILGAEGNIVVFAVLVIIALVIVVWILAIIFSPSDSDSRSR